MHPQLGVNVDLRGKYSDIRVRVIPSNNMNGCICLFGEFFSLLHCLAQRFSIDLHPVLLLRLPLVSDASEAEYPGFTIMQDFLSPEKHASHLLRLGEIGMIEAGAENI